MDEPSDRPPSAGSGVRGDPASPVSGTPAPTPVPAPATAAGEDALPAPRPFSGPAHGRPNLHTDPPSRELEEKVVEQLRSCYDPEIPVNIFELGLIYDIAVTPGMERMRASTSGGSEPATGHIGDVRVMRTPTFPSAVTSMS